MAFSFEEAPDSRDMAAVPPTFNLKYKASGEVSENIVMAYAIGATPATAATPVGVLYRQDVKLVPDGYAQYWVTVPYAQKNRSAGNYTFTFDTTGATVKIKCSKEHKHSYYASGESGGTNPHASAIGVKQDGDVEGADIVIPALKINVQFRHTSGHVTIPFVKALAAITGRTNLNSFLGFAAGELLYLGSTGSDGSSAEVDVAYQFAAAQNDTGLNFGDISSITKGAWEYAWVEFKDAVDSGKPTTQPRAVHIERVYNNIDYASIFGWGS